MSLALAPQCCCSIECGISLSITMSGVANDTCSDCGTQYNDTIVTSPGVSSGDCNSCSKTVGTLFCAFTFGQDSNPCFDDDNDSLVCMFTATDGKKYVAVKLEDDTLGAFGETFAIWLKEIPAFVLPQTLTASDICYMAHDKCDFSSATILLEAA